MQIYSAEPAEAARRWKSPRRLVAWLLTNGMGNKGTRKDFAVAANNFARIPDGGVKCRPQGTRRNLFGMRNPAVFIQA